MKDSELINMELHTSVIEKISPVDKKNGGWCVMITRVIGGWIYTNKDSTGQQSIFVPNPFEPIKVINIKVRKS